MPPNQFAGYIFWPEDKSYYSRGIDPANEA